VRRYSTLDIFIFAMADQVQEILDVPRDFLRDGMQFLNRSQKRKSFSTCCFIHERKLTCT